MNNEINYNITETIKSGSYFSDAREWYAKKYLLPLTHRAFLIMLTALSIFLAIVAVRVFTTFLPLVEVVPIAVSVDNSVEQISRLKYIGKPKEDSNESVMKYLAARYVEAREAYDYESFRSGLKLTYLKDFSSRPEFDKYKELINDNVKSPLFVYKKSVSRYINPIEVVIVDGGKIEGEEFSSGQKKVSVKFRADEVGLSETKSSIWLANILLNYEKVEYSKEIKKFSPLDFKVLYYEVSKLSDIQDPKNEKK